MTVRIYAMIGDVGDDFTTLSAAGPLIAYGDDRLTVRSVKLYADGALGSRGAALLAPYSDQPDLIASMQPTHATSDMNMAEARIGPARLEGACAWRTFLAQGTRIAGGSDFPVEDPNPFFGLYSAVTRMDHHGQPKGGWHAEQAMTRLEAFRAFTLDAAYAQHQERSIGSLEPGKWADFIVIDRDVFTVPASQIWKTRMLQTWLAGTRVY